MTDPHFQPTVGVSSTHPKDMPEGHAAIPVWNAENWLYEDWPVGQKIRSLRRTIDKFSRRFAHLEKRVAEVHGGWGEPGQKEEHIPLAVLDTYWEEAKSHEKEGK